MKRAPTFVEFLERILRVKLEPGQRVLWSVIADGVQPRDLAQDQREIARKLFGDIDEIPPELLSVVAIVKGARIGGSYLAALRCLYLALFVPLNRLAPGELAFGVIVAPDLRLAKQAHRYASGAVTSTPALAARMVRQDETSITLRREDGHEVTIETLPATRGGSALRGRTLVCALLDEAAFFRDENAAVNDAEVYKAVLPRIVPGGQVMVVSTPWAESGLLHELFEKNHGAPSTCVAVHATTVVMRSGTPSILRMVERETERDPDNAAREYGAEFMSAGSGLFFDSRAIDRALVDGKDVVLPPRNEMRCSAAVDPGFTRDAAAMVVVGEHHGRVYVLEIDELRPKKNEPLKPSEVVARWASIARRWQLPSVRSDIHYRESIREHLAQHRLKLVAAPEGQAGKAQMYEKTRAFLNEGRLVLTDSHPRLVTQLREVISKPTPGGGMSIRSPRKKGAHGDIVSALVGAMYDAPRQSAGRMAPLSLRGLATGYGSDADGYDEDEGVSNGRVGYSL